MKASTLAAYERARHLRSPSLHAQLMALTDHNRGNAIVVRCLACEWMYYVVTFACGGWRRPRPGHCERCGAEGSRDWVWARMWLRGDQCFVEPMPSNLDHS